MWRLVNTVLIDVSERNKTSTLHSSFRSARSATPRILMEDGRGEMERGGPRCLELDDGERRPKFVCWRDLNSLDADVLVTTRIIQNPRGTQASACGAYLTPFAFSSPVNARTANHCSLVSPL